MDRNFTNRKDLLVELVRTNFKLKYNNSLLGFIWVLLRPFTTFLVLYVIFSKFKGGWIENYQIYLLLGVILYNFFNEGIVYGMKGILQTAHIILKVNFPRKIAFSSALIMAVINLLINLLILLFFVIFNSTSPTLVSILYFIFILIVLFLINYSISLFTSIILVRLRDLEHIMSLVMQLLFYAIPIFYPLDSLPNTLQKIVMLNPLTILFQAARKAFIYGEVVYFRETIIIFVVFIIVLFMGNWYFDRNIRKIAEDF